MMTPTLTPREQAEQLLTKRERQVVKGLASGGSVVQVAKDLVLAPKTIDSYKSAVMKKLDIHNRAGLTLWACRAGLVQL